MTERSDKLLRTQGHFATDLVTLDFRSDSLQKFLEHVVSIVNQHSLKINKLQLDKLDRIEAVSGHQVITNAISINHPSLLKTIVTKKEHYSDEDTFCDKSQKLANKLDHYNQAIQFLCKVGEQKDKRLGYLEKKQDDLITNDNLNDKLRSNQNESKRLIDDECIKIQGKLKQLQNKMNKKLGDFQNLTKNLQKNTVWKITQCEQGLSKRITPQYVEKAMEQLQGKIIRQVKYNLNSDGNQLKFKIQDLLQSSQRDKQRHQQLFDNTNKNIKQLQNASKNFNNQKQVDSKQFQLESKLKQACFKIEQLQRRKDPKELQLQLIQDITSTSQKSQDALRRLKALQDQIHSLNSILSSSNGVEGTNDPHRVCFLDGQIKRLKDSSRTHETQLNILEEEFKTKLLVFQQRISTSIAMMRTQQNNVSRTQLYQSINRLRQPLNQRFTDHQNLINQMVGKINKLQTTQKSIRKKIKDITKGNDLNKILDQKLNISQAKISSDALNQKIDGLQILIEKMKMDIEYNNAFVKEVKEKTGGVEEGFSIFTNKQKIFPAKCLTCGIKHVPNNQRNEMQGSDGRFYRVDLKNNCVFDTDEVFDVVPSQISLVQTAKMNNNRIQSAKNKSQHHSELATTTGGGFYNRYRPQSAKKS